MSNKAHNYFFGQLPEMPWKSKKEEQMNKQWILKPLVSGKHTLTGSKNFGKPYYEQILVYDELYPFAILHIDSFWEGHSGENTIYNLLNEGMNVTVNVSMEIENE